MANFRDINGASRQINRVTDIELEAHNRSALESVMVCHAATGRVQEMALIAQTLEKVDTKVDLKEVNANLNELVGIMKAKEQPAEPAETGELRLLRAENERLKSGLEM